MSIYNNETSLYATYGNACYDNKAMVNSTLADRQEQQTTNLKVEQQERKSKIKRFRSSLRIPVLINSCVIIIVSILLAVLEWGVIPQTKQGFYCKDPSLSFPFKGDTISLSTLLIGSSAGPLLVIYFVETLREGSFNSACVKITWQWFRELLTGLAITLLLVESGKVIVGEHRPHFFASCMPDTNTNCEPGTFVQSYQCTNNKYSKYLITDSSRSFPSGHAAISVLVSVYTAFVIQWRLPTRKTGQLFKPFLMSICLVWSLICSLTRITDRRHHWWDVLAGTFVGSICAVYTVKILCLNVKVSKTPWHSIQSPAPLDVKNKDIANVII